VSGDSPEAVARDLARYLRQQQERGMEWYLDEGPLPEPPAADRPVAGTGETVAAPAPDAAPAQADRPAPAASPARTSTDAPAPAAPAPAARPPAPAPRPVSAAEDEKRRRAAAFQRECEAFVAEALRQVAARPARAAVHEADLFSAPADEPAAPRTPEQKQAALDELAARVAGCTECKLHAGRTNTVFGSGHPDADLVLVGEAPGRNEDEQGLPFVGRAGQLLTDILKAIGLARDEVYICNILKCRPPNNRDPEADEVRACEPYLQRQLEIIAPRLILCLGRHAAMTLLETRASLRALRSSIHFYRGVPVMATFHPAALLRNPHWKRDTWDDVRKARALYDALRAGAAGSADRS